MKTEQINLYLANELKEEALEKAHNKWYSDNSCYSYGSDNEATLEKFAMYLDLDIRHWEYDEFRYNYRFDVNSDNEYLEELTGVRLATYIYNNYYDYIVGKKFYSKSNKNGYKHRHSKIIIEKDNCPLTGYYLDNVVLQPIFDFLKKPTGKTFYGLMEECLNEFFSECVRDCEDYYSKERFVETSDMNEWYYLEDGTFFAYAN